MAYLNIALLLGAMSITLFSASEDVTSQMFSYIYGAISLGTAVSISRRTFDEKTHCGCRYMDTCFTNIELP